MSIWAKRAENLLEEAASEVQRSGGGDEAIIATTAALAALRIDMGELPESELDGYPFPGEDEPDDSVGCICPPDLIDRGGFRGRCPVHGTTRANIR